MPPRPTWQTLWTILGASAALAGVASAQSRTIRGIVFDSVAKKPLPGAIVQAVAVDDKSGHAFTATADSSGRYSLSGLPSGRFGVGFQNDALSALGLESPIIAVDLRQDSSAVVNLAIPSGRTLRGRLCGASDTSRDGMLAGYLLDAGTSAAPSAASAFAQWIQLDLNGGKLKSGSHRAVAIVSDDGTYRICGVPSDGPVTVHASAKGYRPIDLEVSLPPAGLTRQDFRLVSGQATHGPASISLRVVDTAGNAISSGEAELQELGRRAPVERGGNVALSDMPAGSWVISVRALGFNPRTVVADATSEGTPETVVMQRPAPVLDTVRVVSANVRRDSATVQAMRLRLRTATGTLVQPNNPYMISATQASDALRAAAGFTMKGPAVIEARAYGNGAACQAQIQNITLDTQFQRQDNKIIVIYLNGERVPEGLEAVNRNVPVSAILAVEAYPDVTSAPFLWRTRDACAVVAFWTKH